MEDNKESRKGIDPALIAVVGFLSMVLMVVAIVLGPGSLQYIKACIVLMVATVYKGNIIKNLIMDCQSYTKYRPNETTGGIFVSWRRKEELPTGA